MMKSYDLRGVEMPALGFGTFKLKGDDARRCVRHAIDVGYRHIDTAQMYENESEVGEAVRASGVPRNELFVTTKVWRDNLAPNDFNRSVDECLSRLGFDHVELLLIHWPNDDVPLEDTLAALRAVREAGKARLIGVSNFPSEMLMRAIAIEPELVNNQVEHHVFLGQGKLLDIVRPNDMVLTSYSPVAQGRVFDDATLRDIGKSRDADAGQIALAYLLGMDRVSAIPRSGTEAHIESNLAAADIKLTAEERARIDALPKDQRLVSPPFAPIWDA